MLLAVSERAQPNLGPLQVHEDRNGTAGVVGRFARPSVQALVIGVGAVGEVEAKNIDSGIDDGTDVFVGFLSRSEGCNDLG